MKQFKKQKEEFNGILNASVRTKMPSSDKVMSHDQKHWLKTPIFTHLQFIKAAIVCFLYYGNCNQTESYA